MQSVSFKSLLVSATLFLAACSGTGTAPVSSVDNSSDQVISSKPIQGKRYQVQRGDTLYSIAFRSNNDVKYLAELNQLVDPSKIYPGQILLMSGRIPEKSRISNRPPSEQELRAAEAQAEREAAAAAAAAVAAKEAEAQRKAAETAARSQKAQQNSTANATQVTNTDSKKNVNQGVESTQRQEYAQKTVNPEASKQQAKSTAEIRWRWPVDGKVLSSFSATERGNKGVDIAGRRGSAVQAAAGGTVVYAGSGLRGYGKLVIIKHNDDYLSAYAHNDQLRVKEQQAVEAGQHIADMGSTDAPDVRLHFEIRYRGKPVNPERYLPKR